MGYLEKLFLGTMVLFLSVVLIMFGLYFDLHHLLLSSVTESEPLLSAGEFAYTRAQMERLARPVEIMPRSFGNSDFGLPATASDIAQLYDAHPPAMRGRELVDWWRKHLREQGMPDGDLLEMEALGKDREEFDAVIERVDSAVEYKDYEAAAAALADGIRATDSRNLYVMRDLLVRLVEVYNLMDREEEASRAAQKLSEMAERILEAQVDAQGPGDYQAMAAMLESARSDPGPAEPDYDGMSAAEVKARFLDAHEEGHLTRAEMEEALRDLR